MICNNIIYTTLRFTIVFTMILLMIGCSSHQSEYDKALKALKDGNYDDAINIYNDIITKDSTNVYALINLGWLYAKIDSLDDAMKHLEKAEQHTSGVGNRNLIAKNTEMVIQYRNIKRLFETGNYEVVIRQSEVAQQNFGRSGMILQYRAMAYELTGDLENSNSSWREILSIYSNAENQFVSLAREKLN